jgi:nitrite reductase/ring-hydroxylating ferredoxin subunit
LRHGSTFSLLDGEPQSLPATTAITVLAVEVVDGDVFVELP